MRPRCCVQICSDSRKPFSNQSATGAVDIKLDVTKEAHRQMLIDTFVNAVFVHDDKLLLTFNFKEGTRTITLDDVKTATCSSGSDLDCFVAPIRKGRR